MKWFRVYHDALHDPKVQQLPLEQFKAWFNLLCMASAHPRRGHLPTVKDIAYTLRFTEVKARNIVDALVAAGLIDRDAAGNLRPHNWDARQFKTDDINARSRKLRGKNADPEPSPRSDAPLQATVQKEEKQRSLHQPRTVVGNGISSARADSDPDSDAETEPRELIPDVINSPPGADDDEDSDLACDDESYNQAANRLGYQVIGRGHRDAIESTRALFGDERAVAVGHGGSRINGHLQGQWRFFLSALLAAKKTWERTGRGKDDFVHYILVIAKDHRSYGIPFEPVALPDAPPEVIRPRVYPSDSSSHQAPRLTARQEKDRRVSDILDNLDLGPRLKETS